MTQELDAIFSPKSVAVIGASTKEGSIGWEILHNIIVYGFKGTVYPVNPKSPSVHGIHAYPTVLDIPVEVDMAVVVVPKAFALDVVHQCAEKGVKSIVIITSGFREVDEEGRAMEKSIVDICKKNNMRMVGPNCMGLINASPSVRLDCTFAPTQPKAGGAAFISQSGGLGAAILELMDELNMGVSKFISIGNRADVTDIELIEYLSNDPETKVILLYVESFGDPKRMLEVGRRICKKKPVIVVKAGRTPSGARAAFSHTGSLAASDALVEDILHQIGAIRADSVEELFDYASAFQEQPPPEGDGVGIITNGGGPGIMTADACERNGLRVVEFTEKTKNRLRKILPGFASVRNPVDLVASGSPETYKEVVKIVLEDENVDSLLSIFIPPVNSDPLEIAELVASAGSSTHKTVMGCFMGREKTLEGILHMETSEDIPSYMFPESAVKALAALYKRGMWLKRGDGQTLKENLDMDRVSNILRAAKSSGRKILSVQETFEILSLFGFNVPDYKISHDKVEVLKGGDEIGYPLALKLLCSEITHKTDVGGVVLNIGNREELKSSLDNMEASFPGLVDKEFLVQKMVHGGTEIILGITQDPGFGAVVMAGIGGVFVEVLKDVSFRALPVTDLDAEEMLESLRGSPLLEGFRGKKPVDKKNLIEDVQRIALVASLIPEIEEMDINPLLAMEEGKRNMVVDARISLR